MRAAAIVAAALALGGGVAAAAPPAQPSPWVARVAGEAIPRRPAEALLALVRRTQPETTLAELAQHLALDLQAGDAAAREVGDATLFASMRVGFAPEVEMRRQWLSTLQQFWPDGVERAWKAAPPIAPHAPDAGAWRRLWAGSDGLRLDEQLGAPERAAAARFVLLRHRAFGKVPAGAITLADIWPLQNVQGRRLLLGGDLDFALAQARQLLRERFAEQWFMRHSGWTVAELAFVQRAVTARLRKLAWMHWQGLDGDPHAEAPPRDALVAAVTASEIADYYGAHRDRFARLERVEGWRLRCASEADCTAASDLRALPAAVPLRWSLGDARPAVELDAWALDLLQAWPEGQVSPPIRHPDGNGWERVQVLAVRRGFHPADSETVAHVARQAIALEKLEARWAERQREWLAASRLQWAPDFVAPARPLEPARAQAHGHHGHAH